MPCADSLAFGRAKHKDVIVVYYKDQHFDFVQPHAKYAKELASVTADPNGGFLVGGVSEACSDSTTSHPRSQARRNSRSAQTRPGSAVTIHTWKLGLGYLRLLTVDLPPM